METQGMTSSHHHCEDRSSAGMCVGWSALLSLRHVDFRVVLSGKCKAPDKESSLASGTWSNVLAQPLSDHTDSLLLVSIPVSLYFLLWYWCLAGDLLDFFWSSQKLRLDLFSWETWKIRTGVYISHSTTLNLKGSISSENTNAKFSFHAVVCVVSHKCDTFHIMSWRNNLACDSAPLVCRDPLPFDITALSQLVVWAIPWFCLFSWHENELSKFPPHWGRGYSPGKA